MVNILIGCVCVVGLMVIFYIVGRLIHLVLFGITSRETNWEEYQETLTVGGITSLTIVGVLVFLNMLGVLFNMIIK
jgi:hypothetical protein